MNYSITYKKWYKGTVCSLKEEFDLWEQANIRYYELQRDLDVVEITVKNKDSVLQYFLRT